MKVFRMMLFMIIFSTELKSQLTYDNLYVQYDSAWAFKNLTLVPVRFKDPPPPAAAGVSSAKNENISLAEALRLGKVKVKEVLYENGADINWLHIFNETKQPLLVNSGELLAGGKQDRMVAETKVIEPGAAEYVKVYCIEKGRWDDKIKTFVHSGSANSELKKVMDVSGRQADVWREIERQFAKQKKTSDTWPYLQLQGQSIAVDTGYYNFFIKKFAASDSNYAGFLAISGSKIINCELFASSDNMSLAFPYMLGSLIQSAVQYSPATVSDAYTKKFMDSLLQSEVSQKIFVAKHGQLHKYKERVFHLVAYGD